MNFIKAAFAGYLIASLGEMIVDESNKLNERAGWRKLPSSGVESKFARDVDGDGIADLVNIGPIGSIVPVSLERKPTQQEIKQYRDKETGKSYWI